MGAILNSQLQSVMQEGLLDSLLPYLVKDKKLYKVGTIIFTQANKVLMDIFQPQDLSSESDTAGAGFFPLSALRRQSNSEMKLRLVSIVKDVYNIS